MTIATADRSEKIIKVSLWNSPWLNFKLLTGVGTLLLVAVIQLIGPLLWDTDMATVGSAPINIVPIWTEADPNLGFKEGDPAHPLGTDSTGRDMLALLIVATPRSLWVGLIGAGIGMLVGIILGFSAGLMGGWLDAIVRILADALMTIPGLAVLVVVASYVRQFEIGSMAMLMALFAWPGPTRLIRAQVLSMREQGYIQMAKLSGASTFDMMFKEIMPEVELINIMDDSLLPTVMAEQRISPAVTQRMCAYVQAAVVAGADAVLSLCSSLGPTVNVARELVNVPVIKIDDAHTEKAVRDADRVGVMATVA
ncbi:MAG: ABC transporter permease, partial [Anaerolineaceae bacterium]|nr:ABC transporter permease [Anaerolineaceae bacterium]